MIPEALDFSDYLVLRMRSGNLSENDLCRMAAYWVQDNRCYITGVPLEKGNRELHHRIPRKYGGIDSPDNLMLLHKTVHRMVHAETLQELYRLLVQMPLTEDQLQRLNILRFDANTKAIPPTEAN